MDFHSSSSSPVPLPPMRVACGARIRALVQEEVAGPDSGSRRENVLASFDERGTMFLQGVKEIYQFLPRIGEYDEKESNEFVGQSRLASVAIHDAESGLPESILLHFSQRRCLFIAQFPSIISRRDTSHPIQKIGCRPVFNTHRSSISCFALVKTSEGPHAVVTGCVDGALHVWPYGPFPVQGKEMKLPNLEALRIVPNAHQNGVSAIEGLYNAVATGGYDQCIKLWSLPSGQCVQQLKMEASVVSALSSSRLSLINTGPLDGRVDEDICVEGLLAGSGEGMVFIWSLTNMQLLGVIAGPESRVLSIAASPEQKALTLGYLDGSVTLHRVEAPNFPEIGRHRVKGAAIDCSWFQDTGPKSIRSSASKMTERSSEGRSTLAVWSDQGSHMTWSIGRGHTKRENDCGEDKKELSETDDFREKLSGISEALPFPIHRDKDDSVPVSKASQDSDDTPPQPRNQTPVPSPGLETRTKSPLPYETGPLPKPTGRWGRRILQSRNANCEQDDTPQPIVPPAPSSPIKPVGGSGRMKAKSTEIVYVPGARSQIDVPPRKTFTERIVFSPKDLAGMKLNFKNPLKSRTLLKKYRQISEESEPPSALPVQMNSTVWIQKQVEAKKKETFEDVKKTDESVQREIDRAMKDKVRKDPSAAAFDVLELPLHARRYAYDHIAKLDVNEADLDFNMKQKAVKKQVSKEWLESLKDRPSLFDYYSERTEHEPQYHPTISVDTEAIINVTASRMSSSAELIQDTIWMPLSF